MFLPFWLLMWGREGDLLRGEVDIYVLVLSINIEGGIVLRFLTLDYTRVGYLSVFLVALKRKKALVFGIISPNKFEF